MADYSKPYLDTSVILAFIKGEEGRYSVVADILKAAEKGQFSVYTSTLSIAETHKPRGQDGLAGKESDKVLDFFEYDFVKLVDVDRRIAETAHRLCREFGVSPCDAVHLASALRAKCSVLLAYDGDLFRLQHPDIVIEQPKIVNGQTELGYPTQDNE